MKLVHACCGPSGPLAWASDRAGSSPTHVGWLGPAPKKLKK